MKISLSLVRVMHMMVCLTLLALIWYTAVNKLAVIITAGVVLIFLQLYAHRRFKESAIPVSRRTQIIFAIAILLLGLGRVIMDYSKLSQ